MQHLVYEWSNTCKQPFGVNNEQFLINSHCNVWKCKYMFWILIIDVGYTLFIRIPPTSPAIWLMVYTFLGGIDCMGGKVRISVCRFIRSICMRNNAQLVHIFSVTWPLLQKSLIALIAKMFWMWCSRLKLPLKLRRSAASLSGRMNANARLHLPTCLLCPG